MQTYSDPNRANDTFSLPDVEQHDPITIEDENMTLRLALTRLLDAYTEDVQRCPSMTVAISYATNTEAINRAKQALQGAWRKHR